MEVDESPADARRNLEAIVLPAGSKVYVFYLTTHLSCEYFDDDVLHVVWRFAFGIPSLDSHEEGHELVPDSYISPPLAHICSETSNDHTSLQANK